MSSKEINRDPFIKSIFDEGGIENPSDGFTKQIIKDIKAQSKERVFEYKPVISRNAWLIIAFLGIALFLFIFFQSSGQGQGIELFGYTVNWDTQKITSLFKNIAFSFKLTPIFKTSLLALTFFTFTNLIIFELKSRSFFK